MKRTFTVMFICCLMVAAPVRAETIRVAGSGGMITTVTELARAFMEKNPGETIDVWKESIEAKGGIMGAYEGKIDIGMSARRLNPDEVTLGLVPIEIARVAAVIAVNAETVKVPGLKSDQVCAVFSGQVKNWKEVGGPDAPLKVFTRPEADSTKLAVRRGIRCFATLPEPPSAIVMPKAQDMYNALMNNPYSAGMTDAAALVDYKGKIRGLTLDGLDATEENVRSGKWPVLKHYVLVTKGEPKGLVKRFLDFVRGPEGARVIMKHKAVPIR